MIARALAPGLWWRPAARRSERLTTVAIAATIAGAWVALIAMPWSGGSGAEPSGGTAAMLGMAPMPGMAGMSPAAAVGGRAGAAALGAVTLAAVAGWALMVIAMMVPSTLPAVSHVAANSLRWRRQRAMVTFLLVYLAIWVAVGAVILVFAPLWSPVHRTTVLAAVLAVAAAWQLTPAKRRALRDCHRSSPLAPTGVRATRDVIRFGLRNGFACVRSCWPLMLVMAVASSAMIFWMVVISGIVTTEKLAQKPRQASRCAAALLALAAFVAGVSATFG